MPCIRTTSKVVEDVVKVMGHSIPKGIWTAISRFDTSNTDQRQTGFFGSAEMKKRYIDFTNSMAQYIEQNIKKADPKEQGFIANNLKRLKTERDSLVSKLMVMDDGRKKAEGHEGWDGWEEVEGLENSIEGIENLAYELRYCIRGAKTQCKDWKALALYIKGLASNLDDAAELMAYKRDGEDEDESKKKNLRKDFSPTVAEDWDSWTKAVVKGLVKKYKFSPGWADLCVDGDWKGLVYKYFNDGKSPEECAKAINDTGANESFESAQTGDEVVYKYEVTGFNRGDMNNAKPITDTVVLHFNGAPGRKEANQKAIAEFEKKHSDCYGDTTRLLDIQNIKKAGRNEGLTNFRFKDPESEDDLIGIEDFICEVYRRNKGEDAAEEIQQRMDGLQGQAGSQYIKEKGKDAWDKLEGAPYAQFLFNAIRSIVKDITQEDFRMVYTSPGTDKEYLQEVVLCDKEGESPEYRADDKYDFSSLRK